MTKIEELEQRLEQKRAANAAAELEQYEKDLEARIKLEDEHGTIAAVKVARFAPGQPTRAYLRTPKPAEYKRYKDQIHRAVDKKNITGQQDAFELLAKACWVYPAPDDKGLSDAQKGMLESFPGLLTPLAQAAAALAEGKNEDTGKD